MHRGLQHASSSNCCSCSCHSRSHSSRQRPRAAAALQEPQAAGRQACAATFAASTSCSSRHTRAAAALASRGQQGQGRASHGSGRRLLCAAQPKPQGPATAPALDEGEYEDEGEDGFLDPDAFMDDDEGFFEEEEGGAGEGGDPLGLQPDDACAPGVSTGGEGWAEASLAAARKVLAAPHMANLELYMFRLLPGRKLDIRLDRLDDKYGSPSIDDIEKFSRMLYGELLATMGPEAVDDIALEVSSPGAERVLQLPQDLARFGELPLRVEYTDAAGAQMSQALLLQSYDEASGATVWRLAEVRANAAVKGRAMSKKQKELRLEIPLAAVARIRVFVDF